MSSRIWEKVVLQYYLKSGEGIRVMIGKVADIVLMAEVDAESQTIIRFSFLSTRCNRAPCKMIPV